MYSSLVLYLFVHENNKISTTLASLAHKHNSKKAFDKMPQTLSKQCWHCKPSENEFQGFDK
jgi:hypothetical protein